jgi:predicted dehydrogenase
MKPLNFGVIGLSPGNGHPYSWSAIFNGYDPVQMENCGFPVIPRYLEKQRFPEDAIREAKVTHVWTQDPSLSQQVARASLIPNVVADYHDMIGQVDAILLARDDAETHLEIATPFLEAGMPIYIDKPLALGIDEARRLIGLQQYPGQLFSCSALRYAKEFQLSDQERSRIGRIRHIHAIVPKDWDKYAVHVIEPALGLAEDRGSIVSHQVRKVGDSVVLSVEYETGLHLMVSTMGSASAPLSLRVIGELGWQDLFFQDSFTAFKMALQQFVVGALRHEQMIPIESMLEVVNLIELGRAK